MDNTLCQAPYITDVQMLIMIFSLNLYSFIQNTCSDYPKVAVDMSRVYIYCCVSLRNVYKVWNCYVNVIKPVVSYNGVL